MIIVTESQEKYSLEQLRNIPELFAILEGHLIFNLTSRIDDTSLNKIKRIYLLTSEEIDQRKTEKALSSYSADPYYYKSTDYIKDIVNKFPLPELLSNEEKLKKINLLIQQTQVFIIKDKESYKKFLEQIKEYDDEILIFTPAIKNHLSTIISKLPQKKLNLISNYQVIKKENVDVLRRIDTKKYIEITETLKKINLKAETNIDEIISASNFRVPDVLQHFDDTLRVKLNSLLEASCTRVNIFGKDNYIATKAINYLIQSDIPLIYDLENEVPYIKGEDSSLLFINYHMLVQPEKQKNLYQYLKRIDYKRYIILQAIRRHYVKYFEDYYEVALPESKELRDNLTGVFISVMSARKKLTEASRMSCFLISKNLLDPLFPEDITIEAIDQVARFSCSVSENDLVSNADFWYGLNEEISAKKADIENYNQVILNPVRIEHIKSANSDKWIVYGLGDPIEIDYKKIGMKYIVLIIDHKKEIDVIELRKLFLEKTGNKTELKKVQDASKKGSHNESENQRKSMHNAIDRITEIKKEKKKLIDSGELSLKRLNKFIEEHILYSNYKYNFNDQGKIKVEIIDEELFPS